MNEVVSKMTLGLEYNFVMDELKNYFDNSYLVKIKKGSDIKKTSGLQPGEQCAQRPQQGI